MSHDERKVYGMVHLEPLPGTPFYAKDSFDGILDRAVMSARSLARGGADGCLVQTVDRVYDARDRSDPARIAALSVIVSTIFKEVDASFAIGVQVMRNAIAPSLAIAKVTGARFVRATALVGTTASDGGPIAGDPYAAMAYRKSIDAGDIAVIADIASIHHRPCETVGDLARRAARVGADAVAVGSPDEALTLEWIAGIRRVVPRMSVFVAGHTNHDNAGRLLRHADGVFVGSCLERGGWGTAIDEERTATYTEIVRRLPPPRDENAP